MLGIAKASSTRQYRLIDSELFKHAGAQSYEIPSGTHYIVIEMWGGGGGGAPRNSTGSGRSAIKYAGGGGGGGAYCKKTFYGDGKMQAGDSLNFVVGSGGTAATVIDSGLDGNTGGDSYLVTISRGMSTIIEFDDNIVAGGGGRGVRGQLDGGSVVLGAGGSAGVAIGGDINTLGNTGETVFSPYNDGGTGGDGADPGGGAGGLGANFPPPTPQADPGVGDQPGGGGGGGFKANNLVEPQRMTGVTGGLGQVFIYAYG